MNPESTAAAAAAEQQPLAPVSTTPPTADGVAVVGKKTNSKKKKGGELTFDVGTVRERLASYARDVKDGAAVYLSAVLEEIASSLLLSAAETGKSDESHGGRIVPKHIKTALSRRDDLRQLVTALTKDQYGRARLRGKIVVVESAIPQVGTAFCEWLLRNAEEEEAGTLSCHRISQIVTLPSLEARIQEANGIKTEGGAMSSSSMSSSSSSSGDLLASAIFAITMRSKQLRDATFLPSSLLEAQLRNSAAAAAAATASQEEEEEEEEEENDEEEEEDESDGYKKKSEKRKKKRHHMQRHAAAAASNKRSKKEDEGSEEAEEDDEEDEEDDEEGEDEEDEEENDNDDDGDEDDEEDDCENVPLVVCEGSIHEEIAKIKSWMETGKFDRSQWTVVLDALHACHSDVAEPFSYIFVDPENIESVDKVFYNSLICELLRRLGSRRNEGRTIVVIPTGREWDIFASAVFTTLVQTTLQTNYLPGVKFRAHNSWFEAGSTVYRNEAQILAAVEVVRKRAQQQSLNFKNGELEIASGAPVYIHHSLWKGGVHFALLRLILGHLSLLHQVCFFSDVSDDVNAFWRLEFYEQN